MSVQAAALGFRMAEAVASSARVAEKLSKRESSPHPRLREAQVKAARLVREAVEPVFQAPDRETYWRVRDQMFREGLYWKRLIDDFLEALERLPRNIRSQIRVPAHALKVKTKGSELSTDARAALNEGFRYLRADMSIKIPSPAELGLEEHDIGPDRVSAEVGQDLLLIIWASLLAQGTPTRSAAVADSIARNFAHAIAVSAATIKELIERRTGKPVEIGL
jgi:hypothetical protein